MLTEAFFISPDGKIIKVDSRHIKLIVNYPEKFGLTQEEIQAYYDKHDEPLGVEGNAREEIILDLVRKGWVRVRKYTRPRDFWSIQVNKLTRRKKDHLWNFAEKAIKGEEPFQKAISPQEEVRIVSLKEGQTWKFTLDDISNDILFSEDVSPGIPPVERELLEVCEIADYEPSKKLTEYLDNI